MSETFAAKRGPNSPAVRASTVAQAREVLTIDMAEEEPMDVVLAALTLQALGEPLSDNEAEACECAGTLLAVVQLVRLGANLDDVMRNFEERDYTLRFVWTRATDEVEVIVDWDEE